ncbi:hypothetical protein FGSG_00054 [Fusarium graminearum PH-1]|uniref:Chromosome 1, complete genome n=1 Tax=Gibberella zeae (strain ATCC MYA-4620 / CBS 123657 / FGSC 9075 / NRRL 31084 / PH-1) TaxID=229533 RepID=I1R9C1_GIBZE|nr:hypothetical protein FGSG_00054 [Fusarium graminearum PH-1]ESU05159.1 hypothetical protein FGSG_00054 [Fusarium graminearum PH-1]KAI6762293.1 hypothetical protein HG531_002846 [Fusarium graminearum]CEF71884.1 unnamed protein product [Fusarium graminearum]|eukprot:XP_011315644.1 hypothetical protein FGSG_00054 [Fusarium graminearum PH-1]
MTYPTSKIWFITGASSGLGLELSLAALAAGHRVIGTTRNVQKATASHPQFEKLGGRWLEVDLSQPASQSVIEEALAAEESRLAQASLHWVIVNNAGSTLIGVAEDVSEVQFSQYLQANVYGCVRVWKAALPTLRRRRQGTLITTSSIWGFVPKPEHMLYSAAKAIMESLTESYAASLAPLSIQTLIIEPAGFRTPFAANHQISDQGISKDYEGPVKAWKEVAEEAGKNPNIVDGDPRKFGKAVVDAVEAQGLFQEVLKNHDTTQVLRIHFGSDCYSLFGQRLMKLHQGYERMAVVAKSTDCKFPLLSLA